MILRYYLKITLGYDMCNGYVKIIFMYSRYILKYLWLK